MIAILGWLTRTATDLAVIAVHLAIATIDVILLAVFLARVRHTWPGTNRLSLVVHTHARTYAPPARAPLTVGPLTPPQGH